MCDDEKFQYKKFFSESNLEFRINLWGSGGNGNNWQQLATNGNNWQQLATIHA